MLLAEATLYTCARTQCVTAFLSQLVPTDREIEQGKPLNLQERRCALQRDREHLVRKLAYWDRGRPRPQTRA